MPYKCANPRCVKYNKQVPAKGKCTNCKGALTEIKQTAPKPAAAKPVAPKKDPANLDIRGDRIEPDAIDDAGKLCIYKALAKAQCTDPSGTWKKIIEETKPLRDTYRVSFDEDAWSPALADFYRFSTVATGIPYQDVLPDCRAHHDKLRKGQALPFTSQYFILSIENEEKELIGHAIYGQFTTTKEATTYEIIDNENVGQKDKIASRFQPSLFNVFGRSEDDAAKSRSEKFDQRKARIDAEKVKELTRLQTEKV